MSFYSRMFLTATIYSDGDFGLFTEEVNNVDQAVVRLVIGREVEAKVTRGAVFLSFKSHTKDLKG